MALSLFAVVEFCLVPQQRVLQKMLMNISSVAVHRLWAPDCLILPLTEQVEIRLKVSVEPAEKSTIIQLLQLDKNHKHHAEDCAKVYFALVASFTRNSASVKPW